MKRLFMIAAVLAVTFTGYAQTDTTRTENEPADTIRIGGLVIVKKKGSKSEQDTTKTGGIVINPSESSSINISKDKNRNKTPRRTKTTWFNVDLGFNNFDDQTNYGSTDAKAFLRAEPGAKDFAEGDFVLRPGRSINVNLWIFRQKYGLNPARTFRMTYGLMLELNNYRYDQDLKTTFARGSDPFVFRSTNSMSKNKLAMDYITVPFMLGFDTKPGGKGFSMAAGVSAGYLYSSRNKQVIDGKKTIVKGNLNAEPWKFQYIGELGLGPVKLYGSYAPKSMFKSGLDQRPYNFGVRLGDW